jgi:hypothetical protein
MEKSEMCRRTRKKAIGILIARFEFAVIYLMRLIERIGESAETAIEARNQGFRGSIQPREGVGVRRSTISNVIGALPRIPSPRTSDTIA